MFNFNLSLSSDLIFRKNKTYVNKTTEYKKLTTNLKIIKGESYYYIMILLNTTSDNLLFTFSFYGFTLTFNIEKNVSES